MTFRSATPGFAGSTIALCVVTLLAGCASRSLNAPTVVDWSDGARPVVTTPVPQRAQTYTVKREDTLFSIAKMFNVSAADLVAWNNLGPNPKLQTNQVLRVNAPTANSAADASSPTAVTSPIGSETIEQRPLGSPSVSQPAPGASTAPVKTGPLGLKRPYSDATLAELSRPDGDAAATSAAPAPAPASIEATAPPATNAAATIAWAWPASGKATTGFSDKSKGIDIPGKAGDPVLAAADGKVTFAGTGVLGYGNFIIVRHSPELLSVYANNRANSVKEGAAVTKGQKIAEMGAAGSDPAKLHFEIRNDSKPVDPMKYLPSR